MKIEKVTPVKTWDWYIKWIASIILLSAMVIRGLGNYQLADMCLSLAGTGLVVCWYQVGSRLVVGWCVVGSRLAAGWQSLGTRWALGWY